MSASTVRNYVGVARVFLSWRETTTGTLSLAELDGAAVIAFVLGETRRCSVGSAKCLVTRLRAFLRFLHVEGEIDRDLAGAGSVGRELATGGIGQGAGRRGAQRNCWPVAIGARGSGAGISRC